MLINIFLHKLWSLIIILTARVIAVIVIKYISIDQGINFMRLLYHKAQLPTTLVVYDAIHDGYYAHGSISFL